MRCWVDWFNRRVGTEAHSSQGIIGLAGAAIDPALAARILGPGRVERALRRAARILGLAPEAIARARVFPSYSFRVRQMIVVMARQTRVGLC